MLEQITALLPKIADQVQAIEQNRALPTELVAELKSAGAFRALIPKHFGGLESGFEEYLATVQAVAEVDASTAWCINQGAVIGVTSLWLPEPMIQEIWSDPQTSVANGPPFGCQIAPSDDGYKLNGHWGFSSGCQHATWMMGAARYSEGGWRVAFFRPEQVEFTDNWQVAGLRGTGSFEFRVENLHLPKTQVTNVGKPAQHICDLTIVPSALLFASSFAAVALGVARAALDDTLEIAQGKLPRYAALHLKDDPDVQRFAGQATAKWRSAQAYLYATIDEVFSAVRATGEITSDQRSRLRLCGTHVIRECADVVDLAYKIAGSTAIYQDHPLQRRFQDMRVITQHVQARQSYYAALGRYAISGQYELGPMS